MHNLIRKEITLLALALFVSTCSKDDHVSSPIKNNLISFRELYDQGVDRCLGRFSLTSFNSAGSVREYFFGIPAGRICFRSNDFSMFSQNSSTNDLLIFLHGEGFWKLASCETAETGMPSIPFGMLSPNDTTNPVRNYHKGYIAYCDSSAIIRENAVDSDDDGVIDR